MSDPFGPQNLVEPFGTNNELLLILYCRVLEYINILTYVCVVQYRQGQEAKVRPFHPAGRLGDRCHVAGAGHEGDRRIGRQSADDSAHVAATVRTGVIPGRRSL